MINFYILSKRLLVKREGLSGARVVSMTKKNIVFSTLFIKIYKVWKVTLLKFYFVWNFHNKIVC